MGRAPDVEAGDASQRRAAGALEAEVLAELWAAGRPLSPGDVQARLGGDGQRLRLSYSTVVTILTRLHAKGVLRRERAGRAYRYTPVADQAGLAARRMRQVLDGGPDREAVLTRFVSGLSGRDEELLRRLLDQATVVVEGAQDGGQGGRGPGGRGPGPGERGPGGRGPGERR